MLNFVTAKKQRVGNIGSKDNILKSTLNQIACFNLQLDVFTRVICCNAIDLIDDNATNLELLGELDLDVEPDVGVQVGQSGL